MHPQVCPRFCFVAMFHVERFGRAAFKTVFHFANCRFVKHVVQGEKQEKEIVFL